MRDASTGQPVWVNRDCGIISEELQDGVSLQSEVFIRDDALCFRSPGHYGVARMDLKTGKLLNVKIDELSKVKRQAYRTVFYSYYPTHGADASFLCHLPEGRSLFVDMGKDTHGSNRFSASKRLALYKGIEDIPAGPVSTQTIVVKGRKLKAEWTHTSGSRIRGFIAGPSAVICMSIAERKYPAV